MNMLKVYKKYVNLVLLGILQNYYFVTAGQLILSDALKIIV